MIKQKKTTFYSCFFCFKFHEFTDNTYAKCFVSFIWNFNKLKNDT